MQRAVQRVHGDSADEFRRLLFSYSPQDLRDGADRRLVDYLSHESLGFRVLAINNLRQITGRTLFYNPHVPALRRRTPLQAWNEKLGRGEIRYVSAPPELPPRGGAAAIP